MAVVTTLESLPERRPLPIHDLATSIREVVLLSGSVRTNRFNAPIGRSILALPVDSSRTLLDQWVDQVADLAAHLGLGSLSMRVMLDRIAPMPAIPATPKEVSCSIERDPYDYRGTGGVLRDLAGAFDDQDYILVVNGAQLIIGSLALHVAALSEMGGDVIIAAHRDGTPSGLMLVRCGALHAVSQTGFVDMKEQALTLIAQTHDVRVATFEEPTAQPVRTLHDYLAALRIHHRQLADRPVDHDPFAENLGSTFKVVEGDAAVDPEALLHDAVVLSGAKVEAGGVVVRSLVCPGARVRRGQRIVDRLFPGSLPAARKEGGGA